MFDDSTMKKSIGKMIVINDVQLRKFRIQTKKFLN